MMTNSDQNVPAAGGQTLDLARRVSCLNGPGACPQAGIEPPGESRGAGLDGGTEGRRAGPADAEALAREADQANAAKSEFLARMSHEIRTPMNGIIGMTGLLLETRLSSEGREYAEIIQKSALSLLRILNDVLDFSRIEAGKVEVESIDFDLRPMVDEAVDSLAAVAQEKGLELMSLIDPAVPLMVRGDPGRLRQVLSNLIANSIKFTPQGEILLRVAVREGPGGRAVLRFSVKDTGIGIPGDRLALLFTPFTQADGSMARKYGGTGLGLSICKQLVLAMGGEIGVESREGEGSVFWFTIPLCESLENPGKREDCFPGYRGARVLVMDGNPTNRMVLGEMLRAWGLRAEEAPHPSAALEKLYSAEGEGDPYLLAVLDGGTLRTRGEGWEKRMREDPRLRDTTLALMSPILRQAEPGEEGKNGTALRLTKPVKEARLRELLRGILRGGPAAQAAPSPNEFPDLKPPGDLRILLVEDHPINRKLCLKLLEKMGCRAQAAENGREALRALESAPRDLILMDVQMPVMDGLEAARRIREREAAEGRARVPIIALTAHALKGDREKCLEAGMDDYLNKPLNPRDLEEKIRRWALRPAAPPNPAPSRRPEGKDAVFDRQGLLKRLGNDSRFLEEVVKLFLSETSQRVHSLQEAVMKGDAAAVRYQAHAIRGSSAHLGAMALKEEAFQMEVLGERGDLERARGLLPHLREKLMEFQRESGRPAGRAGS